MSQPKVQAGGILRTSLDTTWQTPPELLDCVRAYFGGPIPFDPATAEDNPTKAERFCSGPPGTMFAEALGKSGLDAIWPQRGTFVNPPYGKALREWLHKIEVEAGRGCEIVSLLSCARWEMGYFQSALGKANALCFIRGRVAFVSSIDGARPGANPFGNMFLGWNVDLDRWSSAFAFGGLGLCLKLEAV